MSNQRIAQLALVVKDYDEALDFYTNKLKFELVEDTFFPKKNKRWVIIKPPGSQGCNILLAKAKNKEQEAAIGNQTGGRVFLFLHTDNFDEDYANLKKHNIEIAREASKEDFGKVCLFKDLYGNIWDLIEPIN